MSVIVSLCVIRIEVCEDHSESKTDEGVTMSSKNKFRTMRGRRQVKDVTIETFTSSDNTSSSVSLLQPETSKKEKSKKISKEVKKTPSVEKDEKTKSNVVDLRLEPITFVSGNAFVEVTKGILHLYKEDKLTNIDHESFHSQIVCILAVPATMTCHDLITYTQACHKNVEHIRIIRDGSVNQYMALMYFRTKESTAEFYRAYNGAPFNSLEPEYVCQLVFVSRVEILNETEDAWNPPSGHTELPTCPVCLERMDESVDGILTILCNHSFHSNCLIKWGDTSCPVCRYVQTPEVVPESACYECHSSESLWICLICGHVGCGRYVQGHAQKHYTDTTHCFSMQLGNNRVWDYVGDNFVHRLLQNKTDGKLVEGPSPDKHNSGQTTDVDEKLESVQLEYSHLLSTQLESQKKYFEDIIARLQQEQKNSAELRGNAMKAISEKFELENKLQQLNRENAKKSGGEKCETENKIQQLTKEKHLLDKKVHNLSTKLAQTQSQLNEEKELCKALQRNQATWQEKFSGLENEFKQYKSTKELQLNELKDQLRDVMFYLEAQKKIGESAEREEIAEGTIVIAESSSSNSKPKRRTRKR
ncbi:BRCA1-associated protein [Planococcus citri]|uniref:BRCA1-associated protein n=1 Tax=Planococcus citri TaxID=170843 RepID=UPI0031F926C5